MFNKYLNLSVYWPLSSRGNEKPRLGLSKGNIDFDKRELEGFIVLLLHGSPFISVNGDNELP